MTAATRILRRPLGVAPDTLPSVLHPVLRRVYAARSVAGAADLDHSLACLPPPEHLGGAAEAAVRLARAIHGDEHILILGDFDADGATSSALAVRALRAMGAQRVGYLVPNRFRFGYGLTPEIVAVARDRSPDLVVTVDNGVASVAGVAAANAAGIDVIVTDHHLPGRELPAAAVIVNPNLLDTGFPSRALAGVGVIFYVMLALRAQLRREGWFDRQGLAEPNLAALLDLVALGTVADVVPLDRVNRILVAQGLERIRAGRACAGVAALFEVAGRDPRRATTADLGFFVGPRLNAAGRLEDMAIGIECLLADDPLRARELATTLDAFNRERRAIERDMQAQALAMVEDLHLEGDGEGRVGLCLYEPTWHQGVVGLLASRLKERLHRPVIAFAPGEPGWLKGSGRSVPGVHIRDVLDAVATGHAGLLERFGGHAMAAGLTLRAADLPAFTAAFDTEVRRWLAPQDIAGVIHSDGAIGAHDLELGLAEAIRAGGPWGQGFPEPLFDDAFDVLDRRVVGDHHLRLTLRPVDGSQGIEAIAFNQAERAAAGLPARLRVAYHLDVNHFRGASRLQLRVTHWEAEP
jgi:single-stranded-DNA-specific exonuclease